MTARTLKNKILPRSILKGKVIHMFLTRKNLKGGRRLKGFPLVEENGMIGTKLGYCENCNESILIKTADKQEMLTYFHLSTNAYKEIVEKLKPKLSFRKRLIKWLVGKLGEIPIASEEPAYN